MYITEQNFAAPIPVIKIFRVFCQGSPKGFQ